MNGFIWLASYPKSGNTWMRVFLTNYGRNKNEPADINDLDTEGIASARPPFDDATGVSSGDLTFEEIERLRPRVYRYETQSMSENIYRKIHDAYTFLPDGCPLIPPEATKGVIYIIRNPLDIVVSYAHHSSSTANNIIKSMADDQNTLASNPLVYQNQLPQRLLSWSKHVLSWIDDSHLPVHVTRYEDLIQNPLEEFTRVIRYIGEDEDKDRIARAVEFSRFEEAQRQEQSSGFYERSPGASAFFRKGKTGSWRESLNEDQVQRIIHDHRDVMERFGYLIGDDIVY